MKPTARSLILEPLSATRTRAVTVRAPVIIASLLRITENLHALEAIAPFCTAAENSA